mmetsp:Transcript_9333/g.21151  ORF Transcript_9333/g.21151 Transcript_9333/m.21151 type:complete len:665 (+) Transcript_9333:235-2229(+)
MEHEIPPIDPDADEDGPGAITSKAGDDLSSAEGQQLGENVTGDDAILDLAELEQLQEEAERMKGLGNRHMSKQEYTRAYNAYSAALQLSPVGPSSHVFLSNRAASLLSLKRYSAAAVDARRAVALAPTFGKAHARLGQALYFLKQYAGAVEAYEDALKFEEEDGQSSSSNNAVTRAYLQKAKEKLAKQEEKRLKRAQAAEEDHERKDDQQVDINSPVEDATVSETVAYSVVTDKGNVGVASGLHQTNLRAANAAAPSSNLVDSRDEETLPLHRASINEDEDGNAQNTTLQTPQSELHAQSPRMMMVKTGPMGGEAQRRVEPRISSTEDASPSPQNAGEGNNDEPDPDFDEALKLQRRATHFLSQKQYRIAVDEFSAALFLVPDDPVLSPQLHIGRAHALNGQERFESAKNDALLALKHILRDRDEDMSAAEAYSVLGKSLYYTKDYHGSIEALEECDRIMTASGGKLSVFDEAYLDQCHEALDAGLQADDSVINDMASVAGKSIISSGVKSVVSSVKEGKSLSNIPKLKPPRFVSREKALQTAPNLPPMPKDWPMQSPTSPSSVSVGAERTVIFLSDAMGIKLNRGTDGLVRVISVADLPPGSPILRKGDIRAGDLIREAGGVDLRRPITATMWGDTVALIKMAPRPLEIIVAKELNNAYGFEI